MSELIVIEKKNAMQVFSEEGAIEPILQRIEGEVRALATADVSTAKARKEIAGVAYRVAQSKKYIDDIGKELVDDLKSLPKRIDATRKAARERLDALRDEIRKPLDEWEAEQARIKAEQEAAERAAKERAQAIQSSIDAMRNLVAEMVGQPSTVIEQKLAALTEPTAETHDDRQAEALEVYTTVLDKLRQMADLARQSEESERREREQRVAAEAEERARKAAEQQVIDARLAQERAERDRIAAEERTRQAEQRAAQQAEQAAQQAAENERKRIETAARQEAEEAARRAADKEHQKKFNREALADLMKHAGLSEEQGKAVILAVRAGHIQHVKIIY